MAQAVTERQRITVDCEVDHCKIQLETGFVARQAHGAVIVRQGKTVVLVTAVMSHAPIQGDFLPLTVEYREKLAAAGRIPGGFLRREGRISDHEVLASRILDRSIRPLFPKDFHHEVQVQATVFSAESSSDEAPLLALIGASAALHISAIPWHGPMGGLRLVLLDGQWLAFPSRSERKRANADLVIAGGQDGLIMLEGGANELAEDEVARGMFLALDKVETVCKAIESLRDQAGQTKISAPEPSKPPELVEFQTWLQTHANRVTSALAVTGKHERKQGLVELRDVLIAEFQGERPAQEIEVDALAGVFHQFENHLIRSKVAQQGIRLDGRTCDQIRKISCDIDWLPTPHGSALFTRGETQALVTCTLASGKFEQTFETLNGLQRSQFLLHYNFPPYSVGETRPLRGPGRREIGHGNLARRALLPVLPTHDEFPYVMRIESDIAESNGSSSMATTCGGCLALMDAGVPLRGMVAGIAMGLIKEDDQYAILSDILGDEDHLGDMDFKVTGTRAGVTAVQMDNKLGALPREVMARALDQAKEGRLHILGEMERTIAQPRANPKEHAPQVKAVRVVPAALAELIGPRGANIKEIEASCEAQVSLDQPGLALIYAANERNAREAMRRVQDAAGVVQVGKAYRGTVMNVRDFGAFVRIYQSAEGLVPVELWQEQPVDSMSRVAKEGDEVVVQVLGADSRGRLRLSRKDALQSGLEVE